MAKNVESKVQVKPDFRKAETATIQKGKFAIPLVDEYRVHINEEAYANMKAHADTTVKVELCGILVGNVYQDEKGIFLNLDAVIEGRDASSQGAQVTFTHQTWNHINDEMDKKYPNKQIVGWYHTHPGFGVFLSGMDLFIQENFFNQPYQIAIVLETHAHEEGCFVWVDGVSTPLKRYWVGEKEIKLAGHKSSNSELTALQSENSQNERHESLTAQKYLNAQNQRPAGLNSILIPILLLLLGYFIGQSFGLFSFKKLVIESIESEFYSIQEFAATNALAKEDFAYIRNEITLLEGEKELSEEKAKKRAELIENIKKLENRYSDNRNTYRRKIQELINTKNSLSGRVNQNSTQIRDIEDLISELYFLRLIDFAKSLKKDGNAKIKIEDQKELERLCRQILALSPEKKQVLNEFFPEIMNSMFPDQNKKSPNDTIKKGN